MNSVGYSESSTKSSLREQNGGNRSEYDDFSFSSEQATPRNVARAHMFDAIDPSMILSDVKSKFISKLGEKEALKILLSRDRDSSTGAHALLVHRKALSSLLRSVSIIDKHVCDSFSFRKVSTKNALFSKYCDDSTLHVLCYDQLILCLMMRQPKLLAQTYLFRH